MCSISVLLAIVCHILAESCNLEVFWLQSCIHCSFYVVQGNILFSYLKGLFALFIPNRTKKLVYTNLNRAILIWIGTWLILKSTFSQLPLNKCLFKILIAVPTHSTPFAAHNTDVISGCKLICPTYSRKESSINRCVFSCKELILLR